LRFSYKQSVSPKQDQIRNEERTIFQQLQPRTDVDCKLLLKTPGYFFLEKGSKVHSVALDESETNSVANWLLSLDDRQRDVSYPLESGLLHRLDFETSGVMVAARTQAAYVWLRKKFKENKVYKEYVCVTEIPLKKIGWQNAWAQNHPRSKKRILVSSEQRSAKQIAIKMKV
jgi:23S rRNA-/tRNA-specific pseudouridylate synthase